MTTNATALADQMTEIPGQEAAIILLVSSRLKQMNEKVVFGYHRPFYDPSDEEGGNNCLLFQLSPTHDVFRGYNAEQPGFKIDENGSLVFGEKEGRVALVLERDLKQITIFHNASSGNGFYDVTSWGGNWEMNLQIEEIEMWLEV